MTNTPKKHLLALDGGGLMGLISLGFLDQLESQLRMKTGAGPEFRLRDYFDYIGGTSTGAIIAAALMLGRSVAEIKKFYRQDGKAMFKRARFGERISSGFSHKFDHRNLAEKLRDEFGDKTILEQMEEGALPRDKHLLIVTRNHETDSGWTLSTNPAAKYNDLSRENCNLHMKLWQLVRASTAAPSFFQPEFVTLNDGTEFPFVDGALTAHNNPALKLFQMATAPEYRLNWPVGEENLLLVSIGAGIAARPVQKPSRLGEAIWTLAFNLPTDLLRATSIENDLTCRVLGDCVHGPAIDSEVGVMNGPGKGDRLFTYVRYDADISDAALKAADIRYPGKKLAMDNVDQINSFVSIGEMAARGQVDVPTHLRRFLA